MAWAPEGRPEAHGVHCLSPVNLCGYHRVVYVYLTEARVWRGLADPRVEDLDTSAMQPLDEHSFLCRAGTPAQRRARATSVKASFWDPAHPKRARHTEWFSGAGAVCVQHWIDVFDGNWPCGRNQSRPQRVFPEHIVSPTSQ